MSVINLTLIVQAFHFVCAFFIVKYLLFKPAIAAIQEEDFRQQSLIAKVQEHQKEVALKERHIRDQRDKLRAYFATAAPQGNLPRIRIKTSAIENPQLDSDDMVALTDQLKNFLVKRLEHVH